VINERDCADLDMAEVQAWLDEERAKRRARLAALQSLGIVRQPYPLPPGMPS
jgi:hypothetical protein